MTRKKPRATRTRPVLGPDMSVADFTSYYWMKDDLVHFTYRLNQWRLAREDAGNLTYGDLIDEWLAERERRRDPTYEATLAAQGEYNLFVRGFFTDPANTGKSLADAAGAWNAIKGGRHSRRYRPRPPKSGP